MSDAASEFNNEILDERYDTYGDPVEMHGRIANIWSGILNIPIKPNEVALCMIGMKLARSQNSPSHEDSLVDVAGYNEIAQLIQKKENHESVNAEPDRREAEARVGKAEGVNGIQSVYEKYGIPR